ncbi:MAG: sulfite exporter TauE/SafE family protein [Clostridia bacterium]|nr:sulfite exporter TauE/SafE family protein [Clostridia bacterium]
MKKVNIERSFNSNFACSEYTIDFKLSTKNTRKKASMLLKLITGAVIGFVNGFWGGGGGMICVPLLIQAIHLPEKKAHATTLLIMLPLSIASLIIYIIKGNMLWLESIPIGLGFVVGGILGALLLKVISNTWLGFIFSVVIITGGIKMLL